MKILISAYSCGPGRGSEPGVGWNAAIALAEYAEVHVLTTFEFQEAIEQEVAAAPPKKKLHFHFFDLPGARWWWRHGKGWGIQLHYLLWQLCAGRAVRRLHRRERFHSAQHVTLVRYWAPSCLRNAGIPYIFGPVAGADLPAVSLVRDYPFSQRIVFRARQAIRRLGEWLPMTRRTLRNAAFVLAATPATRNRCFALGVRKDRLLLCQAIALEDDDVKALSRLPFCEKNVYFGMGLLIHRKRFDLAVRAFANAAVPESRLVLVGGGPEEARLRQLAETLGVADRITITGYLCRAEALQRMASCAVLIHPCDLESGGCVVQEALAAGKPVVALDTGGPGLMLTDAIGRKIRPSSTDQIVADMAKAMAELANPSVRRAMAISCRDTVRDHMTWSRKGRVFLSLHERLL